MERAAEVLKCQFVAFQKCLLSGVRVGPVKGSRTSHTAQAEHLHFLLLASQFGIHLIPIHLAFLAPLVGLRHESLPMDQALRRIWRRDFAPAETGYVKEQAVGQSRIR